jgi:formylglycine-generating enzyme required for sulfatase activity
MGAGGVGRRVVRRSVLRGGSWDEGPATCRSASRFKATRGHRFDDFGFRVVAGGVD